MLPFTVVSEGKRKILIEMLAFCLSELAGDKGKTVQIRFVLKSLSCGNHRNPLGTHEEDKEGREKSMLDSFIAWRHRAWKRLESAS